MPESRLYSDQEISAILKRAGELQATESEAETHGLSLDEIKQIAAEVGLDPNVIAIAAAELERGGIEAKVSGFLGAPTSMHIERVLPGEIDDALMPEVAARIGEAFGMVGRSGQVGRSLEWTHSTERSHLQVTVMPHNGQTKVRAIGKFPRIALSFFLPALVIGGIWSAMIPLGMGASPAIGFSIAAMGLMIGYLFSRFGFSSYVRKKERAFERLMRDLDGMIVRESPIVETTATASVESRIDLPEDEVRQDAGAARARTRQKN